MLSNLNNYKPKVLFDSSKLSHPPGIHFPFTHISKPFGPHFVPSIALPFQRQSSSFGELATQQYSLQSYSGAAKDNTIIIIIFFSLQCL